MAFFAAIVGLYFFKRWAIFLAAVFFATSPLAHYLVGYAVMSWATSAAAEVESTLFGAAVAIAWFSPLRSEFK